MPKCSKTFRKALYAKPVSYFLCSVEIMVDQSAIRQHVLIPDTRFTDVISVYSDNHSIRVLQKTPAEPYKKTFSQTQQELYKQLIADGKTLLAAIAAAGQLPKPVVE